MNARGCYCELWDTEPKVLEQQGIPRGYCGLCEVCGCPGHMRHFPGAVPYTGSWCDWHYRRVALTHPASSLGCLFWLVVFGGVGFVVWWLFRRFVAN
jgi:hypothetical protein